MSRHRAAAILIEADAIALIERHRAGRNYFVLPGGGVQPGENAGQAVVREVEEELGLRVRVLRPLAAIDFRGNRQDYFLVERTGGEFGAGTGPEYQDPDPRYGTYHPVWMPLDRLPASDLIPRSMIAFITRGLADGWPVAVTRWNEVDYD